MKHSCLTETQKTVKNFTKKGFTLIEVMISITLLVIILGVVYSSFFTVQSAIERFDSVSLKYHEVRTVLDIMRREVEAAFLETGNPSSKIKNTGLVIEDRDIYDRTTSKLYITAFSFKDSGLNAISYYIQDKDGKLSLIKAETPAFMLLTGPPVNRYPLEIIEGIENFSVDTLYNNKWVRTWDTEQTESLPEIVRLSIEFDDNGKKVVLTEYARPKIGKQL